MAKLDDDCVQEVFSQTSERYAWKKHTKTPRSIQVQAQEYLYTLKCLQFDFGLSHAHNTHHALGDQSSDDLTALLAVLALCGEDSES